MERHDSNSNPPPQRGIFITLEGVDGAGKSSHVQWFEEQLANRGLQVIVTREPGGTALGESLRHMVLNQTMGLKTETLLMFAARCEHVITVIEPALAAGRWVICDRFTDASYAYQGGGRQLGSTAISLLEQWVHPDLQPDRTFLFDLPLSLARERLSSAGALDRFECEAEAFFERTREAYLKRAQDEPGRICVVDSSLSIPAIRDHLRVQLDALLHDYKP